MREAERILRAVFLAGAIVGAMPQTLPGRHILTQNTARAEQSSFSVELEFDPIQRPVKLSAEALQALSEDVRVSSCLESRDLKAEQLPANWFIASVVHLAGSDEEDLVVLPDTRPPVNPQDRMPDAVCFLGANTAQMWVLRRTAEGYEMALTAIGQGLEVLDTRTNGLRDIATGIADAGYSSNFLFEFDGQTYNLQKIETIEIDAEVPHDLKNFETRKPLTQRRGHDADEVRSKARMWLWAKWKAHKAAYMKVQLWDEDGDPENYTYFISQSKSGAWQVTLKIHRTASEDRLPSNNHGKYEVDELLVSESVTRVEPGHEDKWPLVSLPDDKALRGAEFELVLLDHRAIPSNTL